MSLKHNRGIYNLLALGVGGYFLTILFNGYLRHIGLTVSVIGILRPYMPEMFMIFIIGAWFMSGSRIAKCDLVFWGYTLTVCCISLFTVESVTSILGTIRDLLEPFVLISIVSSLELNDDEIDGLMKLIRNILGIFVFAGFGFALYQNIMGWEWTSKYFAGYSFYGTNSDESLRIAYSWLGFKSLGTTASAETFGFYNAFSILYVLFYGFRRRLVNILLIVLAILSILLSGMKTPLLIAIVIIFAATFLPRYREAGVAGKICIVAVGIFAFIYLVFGQGSWTESSMYARLVFWSQLFTLENMSNLLIPHNLYNFSAMAGNTGVLNFWDNAYFYLAFCLGIGGFILTIIVLRDKYRTIMAAERSRFIPYLYLFLALAGITTCIFLGRCVICTMFIVIGLCCNRSEPSALEKMEETE